MPEPVTYRAARSVPGMAGSAAGSRLRCSATAASASSCAIMECRASAARSAASCSSSASCCPNGRPLSEPTCSTPMTLPPASKGTPSRDLMPRSTSSGFRTVVWSTVVRMTGSRDAATRPAKPVPSGMRTPCRTSSSMPLAAVATSWPADSVKQQHGGGVGLEHFLHALKQGLSSACSSSLDSAASATASMSRSRPAVAPWASGLGAGGGTTPAAYRRIRPGAPGRDLHGPGGIRRLKSPQSVLNR